MEFRKKLISSLFKTSCGFKDLPEYIKEKVNTEELSYKNLKYLYKNLYLGKSHFIKQNIYPVSEFLIKGFSTDEAEKIARLLPDAKKYTIFCYDESEVGYKYNKLFMDLEYAYFKYERIYNNCHSKDEAFEKVKRLIENSDVKSREKFVERVVEKSNDKEMEVEQELE